MTDRAKTRTRGAGILLLFLAAVSLNAATNETWSLRRALDYALSHNPDVRIARQRIVAAQAGLQEAESAFWPKLTLRSGYLRTDNPMLVFGSILDQRAYSSSLDFNDVPNVDNVNAGGMITVPLYAGGKNIAGRQAAKSNARAANQDDAAVRNELGFEVARAFYTVLKAREFIAAADSTVAAYQTNVTIAYARLTNGALLKSDVLDLEVRLAQAREDLVRARNAAALASRALRNLLGIETGDVVIEDTAPAVSAPKSTDFSHRPELAAAREREMAAQAQLRASKSGYQPRVNAFGGLDYDYGTVTGGDGGSYTAGVLLQWDVWDGFATRSKSREAAAKLESAREEQRKLRLALDLEATRARLDLDAATERLAVSQKTVEQAGESAGLIRARFEQGLALSIQLIDAETALLAARIRQTEAESDRRIAVGALRKALAMPQLDAPATVP